MGESFADFVVVGGGVAGVCAVEELDSLLDTPEFQHLSNKSVAFVTGRGGFIKRVVKTKQIGQIAQSFDIEEGEASAHFHGSKRVRVVLDDIVSWDATKRKVILRNSNAMCYGKLLIATGGLPRRVFDHPNVLRIRDLETIGELQRRLPAARRILLVGNGGIASELAFELKNIELIWAIRHGSISATYFDEVAAKFFESKLTAGRRKGDEKAEAKIDRYFTFVGQDKSEDVCAQTDGGDRDTSGCALGPHWLAKLAQSSQDESQRLVHVLCEVELAKLHKQRGSGSSSDNTLCLPDHFLPTSTDFHVWAELTDGCVVGCDLVIEATGTVPNSGIWKCDCEQLIVASDGGILVDEQMETSVPGVYAAGDVCTAGWAEQSTHWTQIRLWTQARQMGTFCARAMIIPRENLLQDIAFDIFTHVTTFFGYKIVFLGDFSAAKLQKPFRVHYRITEAQEYVKVITKDSRVQGAVLIGETDLEETIENLILNGTDISQVEDDLLNPEVDLEDFFD